MDSTLVAVASQGVPVAVQAISGVIALVAFLMHFFKGK